MISLVFLSFSIFHQVVAGNSDEFHATEFDPFPEDLVILAGSAAMR